MGSGVSPSLRVVQQVAAAEDIDPGDLEPPLHEIIDPEALDALVRSATCRSPAADASIEFTYNDHRVQVDEDGHVDVTPTDQHHEQRRTHRRSDANADADSTPKDDSRGD